MKARQLEAEADWASDTANALAAKNAAIQEANARLKRQHEAGEADRSYLLEQLVTVKKDSAALTMHASKVNAVVVVVDVSTYKIPYPVFFPRTKYPSLLDEGDKIGNT